MSVVHASVRVICTSRYTESETSNLVLGVYGYLTHLHEPQTDVPPDMDMHAIIYGYGPQLNPGDIIDRTCPDVKFGKAPGLCGRH